MGKEEFASDVGSIAVILPDRKYMYVITPVYWVPK